MTNTAKEKDNLPSKGENDAPKCGIIMPISPTTNHSEKHWSDVQKLLHRSIINAKLSPINVWNNDLTDRVSERIIGNIFDHDIVVADISDLNPNVMFELGLRLASKKPTVVIANSGGTIPFDIRDFHVLQYPGDLNILDMEKFFEKFEEILNAKLSAYKEGKYTPFLGNIVVDVISPQTRETSIDEIILSRFDDLSSRINRIERNVSPSDRSAARSTFWNEKSRVFLDIQDVDDKTLQKIEDYIDSIDNLMSVPSLNITGSSHNTFKINVIDGSVKSSTAISTISSFIDDLGIPPQNVRFRIER